MIAIAGTASASGVNWQTSITVTVTDGTGIPVSGVTVNGSWSDGRSPSGCSGTTNSLGICTVGPTTHLTGTSSATWTVGTLTKTGYTAGTNLDSSIGCTKTPIHLCL